MPDHEIALQIVVTALRRVDAVIAIGTYGSTASHSWTPYSDIDVIAVLDRVPDLESLRFFVHGIPVDLNLRSNDDSERGVAGSTFMPAATPVWDPRNVLANARVTSRPAAITEPRALRYLARHGIDKLRQAGSDPQKARLCAAAEVESVIRAYFSARGREYPGIVFSMDELQRESPLLIKLLDRALTEGVKAADLIEQAEEIALAPIGGIWKPGEIFAVGWDRRKAEQSVSDYLNPVIRASDEPRRVV